MTNYIVNSSENKRNRRRQTYLKVTTLNELVTKRLKLKEKEHTHIDLKEFSNSIHWNRTAATLNQAATYIQGKAILSTEFLHSQTDNINLLNPSVDNYIDFTLFLLSISEEHKNIVRYFSRASLAFVLISNNYYFGINSYEQELSTTREDIVRCLKDAATFAKLKSRKYHG